jgi:uncharacterized membrane protein YeiH
MTNIDFTAAQYSVEVVATVVFALTGVLAAARKRLDVVGVSVAACLAAFGGGTLRDILLDRRPFFWVAHSELLIIVLAVVLLSLSFMRARHFEPTERLIRIPDAVGLGLFAASGTQLALTVGTPYLVAVILGVITAVFGGVLRDIFCNDLPKVFKDHQPYAICAFLAGWAVVACNSLALDEWASLLIGASTGLALRVGVIYFDIRLPAWRPD